MDFSYESALSLDYKFVKKVLKKIAHLSQNRRYRNAEFHFLVPVATMEDLLQQYREKIGVTRRSSTIEFMLYLGSLIMGTISAIFMAVMAYFGIAEFNGDVAVPDPANILSFSCHYSASQVGSISMDTSRTLRRYSDLKLRSGQSSFHDRARTTMMLITILSFALFATILNLLNGLKSVVTRRAIREMAPDKATRIDACLYFIDVLKEAGETTERGLGVTIPTGTILCSGSLFESESFKKAYGRFVGNFCYSV